MVQTIEPSILFQENTTAEDHYAAHNAHPRQYKAAFFALVCSNIQLPMNVLTNVFTVALALNDYEFAEVLLNLPVFTLQELLSACKKLDSKRLYNARQKRVVKLEAQGAKASKIAKAKRELADVTRNVDICQLPATLSGAKIRFLSSWIYKLPEDRLIWFASCMSKNLWRELADLLHLSPNLMNVNWFLPHMYGSRAPRNTVVREANNITAATYMHYISKYQPDYSLVRRNPILRKFNLTDDIKTLIAMYTPVHTLLWYWEDLQCESVNNIINTKLMEEGDVDLQYGKLLERLITINESKKCPMLFKTLQDIAEERLREQTVMLEKPVAVLGDASGSMQVAINTSSIIASLLTAMCDADLRFFRTQDEYITHPPRTVKGVVELSQKCRAGNMTSPVASLYPYYRDKKVIKTFILVTDEIENVPIVLDSNNQIVSTQKGYGQKRQYFQSTHGTRKCDFAQLFKYYSNEVFPARLVFFSFIQNNTTGQMVKQLNKIYPDCADRISVFRFNKQRPDLSKLDHIFGLLYSESDYFHELYEEINGKLALYGVKQTVQKLKIPQALDL